MNKASRLYCPALITPKNAVVKQTEQLSRSQKLLTELGLIKSGSNGTYQIMPLAQRSVDKFIDLVQRNMQLAGGQKITLPVLTPSGLWKKTGRLDGDISEFYMVRDHSGKQFLMSPVNPRGSSDCHACHQFTHFLSPTAPEALPNRPKVQG
ncbi:probable proline--tRNA ligase, mitochondrial isoform X3 [Drosophila ficusphila]|uniref:probable proline--tRNA ligase, mitochondrial isoform X3 n=1 Tax=Drosophila ficusphila TaxID=30025 RepID=UPI0007E6B4CE|nr:probable proline--tRNA ligase, mitochondrial isoform X3 [Drosophila ficusphila]